MSLPKEVIKRIKYNAQLFAGYYRHSELVSNVLIKEVYTEGAKAEATRSGALIKTLEKIAEQKTVAEIPEHERDNEYRFAYDTFIFLARDAVKKYNQ